MGLHVAQEGFQRCQANVSRRTTEWGQQILVVDEETIHRVEHVKGVSNQKTIKTNFILHHHVHIYKVIIQTNIVILAIFFKQHLSVTHKAKNYGETVGMRCVSLPSGVRCWGATTVCFKPPMIRNSKTLTLLFWVVVSNIFYFHPYLWK